ncbi:MULTISPECIES: hypothetical protein [unclassified Caballeronia]|nr:MULTISPECIES: hypothetical protein [unclassified Caballeronia]
MQIQTNPSADTLREINVRRTSAIEQITPPALSRKHEPLRRTAQR